MSAKSGIFVAEFENIFAVTGHCKSWNIYQLFSLPKSAGYAIIILFLEPICNKISEVWIFIYIFVFIFS